MKTMEIISFEKRTFEEIAAKLDFVRAAGGCDFDIDVKCDRTFIDAKSLLGMIGLGVKKNLQVCYGGKNENFENVVAKFAVA